MAGIPDETWRDMMDDDHTVQAVDAIAETVEDDARRLGISAEELADRVLTEVKARGGAATVGPLLYGIRHKNGVVVLDPSDPENERLPLWRTPTAPQAKIDAADASERGGFHVAEFEVKD